MLRPASILCAWLLLVGSMPIRADDFTEVPFEVVGRVIFLKVEVNGKGPLNFILDTGATETIITPPTAESVGIRSPKSSPVRRARANSVAVGSTVLHNLTVYVFDPPQALSLRLDKGMNYHGILGYTFLSRFVTTIDYKRRRVSFTPLLRYGKKEKKQAATANTREVPFTIQNGLVHAKAEVDGKRDLTFLVDTGSAEVLILPAAAKSIDLKGRPLPGYKGVELTRIGKITMGGLVVENLSAIIHHLPRERRRNTSYEGILGSPFLSHFLLTIDYRNKILLLTPNPGGALELEPTGPASP